MYFFILGFQRRVWWPKWTPASRSCFIETTAIVFASKKFSCTLRTAVLFSNPLAGVYPLLGTKKQRNACVLPEYYTTHHVVLQVFFVFSPILAQISDRNRVCNLDFGVVDGFVHREGDVDIVIDDFAARYRDDPVVDAA